MMPEGLLSWGDPDCEWKRDYYEFEVGGITFRLLFFEGGSFRFDWYLYTVDQDLPMVKPYYRGDAIASHWNNFVGGCKTSAYNTARTLIRAGDVSYVG